MEFRVLGGLDIWHDGAQLEVGAPKRQTVLAALLMNANEVLTTERLVDSVWWDPPVAAGSNLRVYLAGLRRVLRAPGDPGSRLRTVRTGGYRVDVQPGELDLDRFNLLAEQGEQALDAGRLPAAADCFDQALRLWRGRPLQGVTCGPALHAALTRLEERRLVIVEQWAQARLDLGEPEQLVIELRVLVKENPLRERLWAHLMLALLRSGRQGEALAAYADLRAVLAEELGVEPARELRRLHEQILRGDAGAGWPVVVSGTASPVRPRQLPAGPSELYGRAAEVGLVAEALTGDRAGPGPALVAVDGVAGVGKSALALAAAHGCAAHFPDGHLYVDLLGATPGLEPLPPIGALGRFLRALGVRPGAVPGDEAEAAALFRSLVAQRRVLVVLDDAASLAQVRPLLPAGSGCAVLITSREVLTGRFDGVRVPLDPLAATDAAAMLAWAAGAARAAAEPDAAARIAALCGHLPLALRIAGARLAARPGWPLSALAERLEAAGGRLDELAVADLAVRSSIELTYRALSPRAQLALRRLGQLRTTEFPSWALAALLDAPVPDAERVLDELGAVHLVEAGSGGEYNRHRLHDLVRLYAEEQSAAVEPAHARAAASRRLVGACLALVECANARSSVDPLGSVRYRVARWSLPRTDLTRITADPRAWLDGESALLVAAVADGLDARATRLAGCLAAALTTHFRLANRIDQWRRVQTGALAAAQRAGDRATAGKLHRGLGELDTIQDRYPDASRHFEAVLAAGADLDPRYEAAATAGLANLHRLRGQYAQAAQGFRRARLLALRDGNVNGQVYATGGIGVVHLEQGRLAEAAACFEECLRLARHCGYPPGEAQALRCLGHVHRACQEHDLAAVHFAQAKRISDRLGDRMGAAHAACWLGHARVRQGRHAEGRELLARCLWAYRRVANGWGEAATLWALAVAQLAAGRPAAARHRAEQAIGIWRRIGSPYWLATGIQSLADAYDALGDPAAARRARCEADDLRRRLAAA